MAPKATSYMNQIAFSLQCLRAELTVIRSTSDLVSISRSVDRLDEELIFMCEVITCMMESAKLHAMRTWGKEFIASEETEAPRILAPTPVRRLSK